MIFILQQIKNIIDEMRVGKIKRQCKKLYKVIGKLYSLGFEFTYESLLSIKMNISELAKINGDVKFTHDITPIAYYIITSDRKWSEYLRWQVIGQNKMVNFDMSLYLRRV